jgi:hypothetical protein
MGLKVEALARQRFQQACDLGLQTACQAETDGGAAPTPR